MASKDRTLAPIRPNAGLEVAYRTRLTRNLIRMHRDVIRAIRVAYRANTPEIAQDASPARELADVLRRLRAKWSKGFDELAPALARYFATESTERVDGALKAALRRAGFSVKFTMSRTVNDVVQASIAENVALIKSIPARYFDQIEGDVMRSVQTGRDLHQLTGDLTRQFDVTRRRAAFIARDQNNKATAVVQRARQEELGITHAQWVHPAAGREPRPSHVKAGRDKVIYNIREGWLDPAINRRVWPGSEINCHCFCKIILPGLSGARHD